MTEQTLSDAILQHTLQILRLGAGQANDAEAILIELTRELKLLLDTADLTDAGKRDIAKLIAEGEAAIASGYEKVAGVVDTHALAIVVAQHTREIISGALSVEANDVSPERLRSLTKDVLIDGAPSSAWWAKQSEDLQFQFSAQVKQGVANGETTERIVQRVIGRGGEPGILVVARRHARTLIHSSVQNAAAHAREATFRANQRLFKGVRWLSTLDTTTCFECANLHNQAWDFDHKKLPGTTLDYRLPLAHWNCRCTITGVRKTLRDRGIDSDETGVNRMAAEGGPITGDTSFDAFLDRMSPAQVERFLGTKRAEMYRAGKLTLRDLVSGTGRPLTLDEITAH